MENQMMTTDELNSHVDDYMKRATTPDKKWIYNYFTGHDEFPIITDEHVRHRRRPATEVEEELV